MRIPRAIPYKSLDYRLEKLEQQAAVTAAQGLPARQLQAARAVLRQLTDADLDILALGPGAAAWPAAAERLAGLVAAVLQDACRRDGFR